MNETPVTTPVSTPREHPAPVTQPASQLLSTWSLILAISSAVLAILFFIAIPAAIAAIILGIIVLVKHRPGKGKALAGIIIGGIMLLVIPFIIAIALVAYNGINKRANDAAGSSNTQQVGQSTSPSSDGLKVQSPCYSYTIPTGYEYATSSVNCTTAVNIPKGDTLTRITVKGNTGTIGSLQDVVTLFNKTIKQSDPNSAGVIDQESLTIGGRPAYYISYKDSYGLLFGNYIFPDDLAHHNDENGKTIVGYTVAGYTYNSGLKSLVRGVADSLDIK